MKKFIRNNITLIIGLMIGIIIPSIFVYAVNSLSSSSITIDKTNGKLEKVNGNYLNNALDYLYEKANTTNMITIESGVLHETQTYLGIVYLDPTDLNTKCSAEDAKANRNNDANHTITGVKTGCMKWYIYKDNGNSYQAILDHNTTAKVQWNSDNVNTSQKEVADALTTDTTGWVAGLSPRLITANEVAEITGANTQISWDSSKTTSDWFCLDVNETNTTNYCAKSQGTSNYAWLFDNLGWISSGINSPCMNFGCNYTDTLNSTGYWTDTAYVGNVSSVWYVDRHGFLVKYDAYNTDVGLRPVITISKSLFNN